MPTLGFAQIIALEYTTFSRHLPLDCTSFCSQRRTWAPCPGKEDRQMDRPTGIVVAFALSVFVWWGRQQAKATL